APEAIVAIIRWVDERARNINWDDVWESQGPEKTTWPQDDAVEEQWARQFEQLFLGTAFSSPASTYGLTPTGEGLAPGEGWTTYVYNRIQRQSRWVFERPVSAAHKTTSLKSWGSCNVSDWRAPSPTSESILGNWE